MIFRVFKQFQKPESTRIKYEEYLQKIFCLIFISLYTVLLTNLEFAHSHTKTKFAWNYKLSVFASSSLNSMIQRTCVRISVWSACYKNVLLSIIDTASQDSSKWCFEILNADPHTLHRTQYSRPLFCIILKGFYSALLKNFERKVL